ncbi:MAG: dihydrodipicolinate synthase family protein [Propionicimonas sp.]|nr:dihydrodipicolinate synthase family protein [Propionicimonas sp.]
MTMNLGGVVVATTLPYAPDPGAPAGLAVDYDRYAEHVDFLSGNGCRGVGPNGSLGEYSSLTDQERRRVVQVAVEATAGRGIVIAGVHGVGWHQARRWAELVGEDGADGVLLLPPTLYRANPDEVLEHYARVAEVGLPVMAYNNPFDTKVDLVPELVARLAEIPGVVAIKEFSGDARRAMEIADRSGIDVIAGADDLLLELMLDGAVGWFAGFPNAFPVESVTLYNLCRGGEWARAAELYRALVPVFRWDSRTEFVQAIKLSMDLVGRYGGPCRPPRGPLSAEQTAQITAETARAVTALAALR